jgi:hypothetical protein
MGRGVNFLNVFWMKKYFTKGFWQLSQEKNKIKSNLIK